MSNVNDLNNLTDFLEEKKESVLRQSTLLNKLKEKRRNVFLVFGDGALHIVIKVAIAATLTLLVLLPTQFAIFGNFILSIVVFFIGFYSLFSISTLGLVERRVLSDAFLYNLSDEEVEQISHLLPDWAKKEIENKVHNDNDYGLTYKTLNKINESVLFHESIKRKKEVLKGRGI